MKNRLTEQLFDAIQENVEYLIPNLIQKGTDLECHNKIGKTPLVFAAYENRPNIVKMLLSLGAQINAQDEFGQTALMEAAYLNYVDIVQILLDNYAQTEIQDEKGRTAMILAAQMNCSDVIKLLAEHGANLEARDTFNRTPLLFAANEGNEKAVDVLLKKGAQVNAVNRIGQTALMKAVEKGYRGVIRKLFKYGASLGNEGQIVGNIWTYVNRSYIEKLLVELLHNKKEAMLKLSSLSYDELIDESKSRKILTDLFQTGSLGAVLRAPCVNDYDKLKSAYKLVKKYLEEDPFLLRRIQDVFTKQSVDLRCGKAISKNRCLTNNIYSGLEIRRNIRS